MLNVLVVSQLTTEAWKAASRDECPGTVAWKVLYEQKLIEAVVRECAILAYYGRVGILDHFGLE
jgi:hypothetical protein